MSTASKQIRFATNTKPENHGAIRKAKPIVRHLAKRKALKETWYINNLGNVLGPYDGHSLRSWLESNQMGTNVEIRMSHTGDFAELTDHFPNIDDAFCVPSMLCLHILSYNPDVSMTCVNRTNNKVVKNVNLENVIDRFLTSERKDNVDIWMGEYFVGKLSDIGMSMIRCNMERLESEMEKEMTL
jgi:hypothetical protein